MTTVQSMMLTVCFGAVMGFLIADVVFLVRNAMDKHKERKREEKESADKAA
jgi:large-conductance mechanosensitive channel